MVTSPKNDHIHLCLQNDVVAWTRERWVNLQFSIWMYQNIHKNVEGGGNGASFDAKWSKDGKLISYIQMMFLTVLYREPIRNNEGSIHNERGRRYGKGFHNSLGVKRLCDG